VGKLPNWERKALRRRSSAVRSESPAQSELTASPGDARAVGGRGQDVHLSYGGGTFSHPPVGFAWSRRGNILFPIYIFMPLFNPESSLRASLQLRKGPCPCHHRRGTRCSNAPRLLVSAQSSTATPPAEILRPGRPLDHYMSNTWHRHSVHVNLEIENTILRRA
jgi:hypothetical protein